MAFDTGDTAWMLMSAALVCLMTPGLAFFYGGLVHHNSTLLIVFQSFVSMAIVDVVWYVIGYSMAFSGGENNLGIIGDAEKAFLIGVDDTSISGTIPEMVFFVYQMMFAIITPALITGAWADRVRFHAYCMFLPYWLLLGGIVVHATAGMAAVASVMYVGSRPNPEATPHSIPLMAIGTALLWFGWFGFNAGSALSVATEIDGIDYSVCALAFVNTEISASIAALVWMLLDWTIDGRPKLTGFLTGAIAGLATITPAAGFVEAYAAIVIGCLAGAVCWLAVWLKNRWDFDDALDVFGVHGVGGVLGSILLGLFATAKVNPSGADGAFYGGGGALFGKQIVAVLFASFHSFVFTYGGLWIIDMIFPVTVIHGGPECELDQAEFGEVAYGTSSPSGSPFGSPKIISNTTATKRLTANKPKPSKKTLDVCEIPDRVLSFSSSRGNSPKHSWGNSPRGTSPKGVNGAQKADRIDEEKVEV
ncbi:unnamed protein product [Vitrella brassicaformis CCMP3155]|uniref:Ammonium transporter AmtB-like domain-containing protein n=1 Tax=Vitrella brassicaformis (strain CCMP3155) TaxID=1169540 RepID=A0A0G4G8J9_VITBC|nr:unnamed protein product [Vitrella brassicaformis CCMP3155]|eukprot:CEM25156.1 unnamed protein product [Vitrella brassicaformis CCMP3155]